MENYKNLGGDSNILAYELGDDYIKVQFGDQSVYLYTYNSAGKQIVEEMKRLAVQGEGLNEYINKHARKLYESKN